MENINVEDFELYLNWTVSVLQTQDLQVIRRFKQEACRHLSSESLMNILIAALDYLANTEPELFQWALHNYDSSFYTELRRKTVVASALQLIRHGFIPGRDFSSIPVGGLFVTPEAKAVLNCNASVFSASLLREILHTFKKT